MPNPEPIKQNCRYCNEPFVPEHFPMLNGQQIAFPYCSEECRESDILAITEFESQRDEFDRKKDALRIWEAMVPINMRETDISRLPKIEAHIDWVPGDWGRGLTIIGKTGAGKTRLTYLILKNLVVEKGLSVCYFRPGQFALKSQAAWMNNHATQFYGEMLAADVVIFDDLGKEKFTETRMMDFFTMVNDRLDNRKPMIFTTNYDGDELAGKFEDKNFAAPFIRRIRESTETINL